MCATMEKNPDNKVIIESVERVLSEISGNGVAITTLHRKDGENSTSFRSEILTVDLNDGSKLKVFLKDFGYSRLPKDGLEQRRERELHVYQDLIGKSNLGTAEFYGSIWDGSTGTYWILLEFVEGEVLRNRKFEDWVKAAGWLGRMQSYFARQGADMQSCGFLIPHDADFFWSRAELAHRSVSQFSLQLAERLSSVLKHYDTVVSLMAGQPRTLVHGSYRPQNILVGMNEGLGRICPVDWELAAYGATLYDFAFLADGFKPPRLEILWEAYLSQLSPDPSHLQDTGEMGFILDCFRLHKVIKSLGDSVTWKFPEETVVKLVSMVEDIGQQLTLR